MNSKIVIILLSSFLLISCEPAIWQGIATGMSLINPNGYSAGSGNLSSGSYSSASNYSTSSSTQSSTTKRVCSMCKGTGRMVKESSVATFGLDEKVKCDECGGTFWRSTGHSHVACSVCHGKGSFN